MTFNYKKARTIGRRKIVLKARLSDPCRNGHNDFAFIADVYKKIGGSERFSEISAGAIFSKENILLIRKFFPDVVKFLPLHFADEQGRPMYYVENAVYLFKTKGVKSGADYLNIDEETASKIWERIKDFNEKDEDFKKEVEKVYAEFGLFDKWQKLADECISYFTSKTDNEI